MLQLLSTASKIDAQLSPADETQSRLDPRVLFAPCNPFSGPSEAEPEDGGPGQHAAVNPLAAKEPVQALWLRLCAFKAEALPEAEAYVVATLRQGEEGEKVLTSPPAPGAATTHPVWSWAFEEKLDFAGAPEDVTLAVYGRGTVADRFLGSATLRVPPRVTDGPQRKVLVLHGSATPGFASCGQLQTGKLIVVWELVKSTAFAPHLAQVAEFGPEATEKGTWTVDARVISVSLNAGASGKLVKVELQFVNPADSKVLHRATSKEVALQEAAGALVGVWQEDQQDGWRMKSWEVLSESRASLMRYILQIQVLALTDFPTTPKGGKGAEQPKAAESVLCTWRDGVNDLLIAEEAKGQSLRFGAELLAKTGAPLGWVSLELDIYHGHPHGGPEWFGAELHGAGAAAASGSPKRQPPPLRGGMPAAARWDDPVKYHCAVCVDGLARPGGRLRPWVRVALGDAAVESHAKATGEPLEWFDLPPLKAKLRNRHATIQVFNDDMALGKGRELMCQAVLHDLRPGASYWLHCFGPAAGATDSEAASRMLRGLAQPASTYCCSVHISFGTHSKILQGHFKAIKEEKVERKLVVRLHRGLYLKSMAGKRVQVLVQLAGCFLPDFRAYGRAPSEAPDPSHFNRNLLSFPGRVDSNGLLLFSEERPYLERETPDELPLKVPPGADFAYLYVVGRGEEAQPPPVFARLRLGGGCEWARMRFDPSAGCSPVSHFPSDLAGFIWGSAWLAPIKTGKGAVPALPAQLRSEEFLPQGSTNQWCCTPAAPLSIGSPGLEPKPAPGEEASIVKGLAARRRLFCHLDVLAVRNLPEMDDDGLCDPCYTVHVHDTTFHQPPGETKSVNPTFLHRIVIPVDVEDGDLPPVILRLQDEDRAQSVLGFGGAVALQDISTVSVTDVPLLDAVPGSLGVLDLNNRHRARWYALDKDGWSPFDGASAVTVDPSWLNRPRVLLAAAYSALEPARKAGAPAAEAGYRVELEAAEYESFQVEVNLLGLRNLPANLFSATMRVTSWWEPPEDGPVSLSLESALPFIALAESPNFGPGGAKDWEHFAQRVRHAVCLMGEGAHHGAKASAAQQLEEVPHIALSSLVGERLRPPLYRAPVIPYLQPPQEVPAKAEPPVVLMPSLCFTLRNSMVGTEYGTVSVPINDLRKGGSFKREWCEVIADEIAALPADMPQGRVIEEGFEHQSVYDIFVDVFAVQAGYVTLDPDVRVGRTIKDHLLFTVAKAAGSTPATSVGNPEDDFFAQYFNPFDYLCSDPRFGDEPFDERCMPTLTCPNRTDKKHQTPLSPGEIFKPYLDLCMTTIPNMKGNPHRIRRSEDLRDLSTGELSRILADRGWRIMSHLTVPEPEQRANAPRLAPRAVIDGLQANMHTFIRPVGHIIGRGEDRDSTLLARLRMGPPAPLPNADALELAEQAAEQARLAGLTMNFLCVRFKEPGVVVWVAPDAVGSFARPGAPLLAVQRTGDSDDLVVVAVPSFDIRYPFEQSWFPTKTLRQRGGTLRRRLEGKREDDEAAQQVQKYGSAKPVPRSPAADPQRRTVSSGEDPDATEVLNQVKDDMRLLTQQASGGTGLSDGYVDPVWVERCGFVLRLQKATHSKWFERCNTRNWYRSALEEVFPEVRTLDKGATPDEDHDLVRCFATARLMNLRAPFHAGASTGSRQESLLKGHITCRKVEAARDVPHVLPLRVEAGVLPVQQLWRRETICLGLKVLTAHQLPKDVGSNFYVVARLGRDTHLREDVVGRNPDPQRSATSLYCQFKFQAELPGPSLLEIELWQSGLFGSALVGTAQVDIEDRWFMLRQRNLRERSQIDFLRRATSPLQELRCAAASSSLAPEFSGAQPRRPKWLPAREPELLPLGEGAGHELKPRRQPSERMPLETLDLKGMDETFTEVTTGSLRMWLDLEPLGAPLPELSAQEGQSEYELRVRIYRVTNVQVYRDAAERNDLYVRARFKCRNRLGAATDRATKTDCHKFAVENATFNWQWAFKIQAPVTECSIQFTLMDADAVTNDDEVYYPREYPLDDLVRLAIQNDAEGRPPLPVFSDTMIFNKWPRMDKGRSCGGMVAHCLCPCWFRKSLPKPLMSAEMSMEVEILRRADADKTPFEDNMQFRAAADRLSWRSALQDPGDTLLLIVGPTRAKRVKCVCSCFVPTMCCLAMALIVVLLLYYLGSIFGFQDKGA